MTRALPLLAALAAATCVSGLSGCSGQDCGAPPDWPARLEFTMRLPDQGVEFERFSVDRAGRILWTGFPRRPTPIGIADFREIAATAGEAPMEPFLVLDAPAGADCETVRAVRAEMDRLPACRRGRCVDGKVWDRSDPPRGGY